MKLIKATLRQYYKAGLAVFLFFIGFIIAGLIYPAINCIYSPTLTKDKQSALKTAWLKWFGKVLELKITHIGEPADSPCLFVSNHISWLDISVIGQFVPAHFVAKSDILSWPVIGYLAKQAGTIFVSRANRQQVTGAGEQMLWLLKQNRSVIVFPEGTTTSGNSVLPFHSSLFQPALLSKAAIQPVALEYRGKSASLVPFVGEDAFLPHLFKILALSEIEVRLVFQPVLKGMNGQSRQFLSSAARLAILEILDENNNDKQSCVNQ